MKISIIIPTYNEEKYIGESLDSLKHLTLPHEVIVTDDKSKDKTVEIAIRKGARVLAAEVKHRSIAENRNEGAKVATGDLLVFMDADSRIPNPDEVFGYAIDRFKTEPNLVALVGPLHVDPNLRTAADSAVYFFFNLISEARNNLLKVGEGSTKFQIIRRSAFEQIKGFRADLVASEDSDIMLRLSKIGKTRYDHRLLINHSGRRSRRLGWPRLLFIWMHERLWAFLFNKSWAKEWIDIR